ncbi:MAG TPA: GTPase Era [Thermoleophilia bacterium]|nr:GTPase Era [Thermoleophilia bacterium]
MNEEGRTPFRSGFVAVLGRPNVGKSTIVNRLVGQKVSIVSDHPQTTRRRISGVINRPGLQLVLLDLPGFQRPFDSLTRRMQATVDAALGEVDAALFVLNADERLGGGDRFIAEAVAASRVFVLTVLNKTDIVATDRLPGCLAAAQELTGAAVRPVSALTGLGLDGVVADLAAAMPEGPVYFPGQVSSDQPVELLIAELIREKALALTREEVPHAVAVEIDSLEERRDRPLLEIEARLVVETESQKGILIGKGGAVVKRIGSEARQEIEAVLGAQVFLGLRVKVRRRWRRDESYVERLL